jgi:thymidylate kinase
MFLALEGGDGTGKSTIASRLSQAFDFEAYATPPQKYKKYREEVDRTSTPIEHYNFYKESIIDASQEISQLIDEGKHVICDRYWISTLTYHEVMGVSVDTQDFERIIKPDLTILLVTTPGEQIKRMVTRGMSAGDRRMLDKQQEISTRLFQNLILNNSPFVTIDTGRFSVDDSIKIILTASGI